MMKHWMLSLVLSGAMGITVGAQEMSLPQALASVKVCEGQDGYIQATPGNEDEVAGTVATVNAKRRQVYSSIAQQRNVPLEAVAAENGEMVRGTNPAIMCR